MVGRFFPLRATVAMIVCIVHRQPRETVKAEASTFSTRNVIAQATQNSVTFLFLFIVLCQYEAEVRDSMY